MQDFRSPHPEPLSPPPPHVPPRAQGAFARSAPFAPPALPAPPKLGQRPPAGHLRTFAPTPAPAFVLRPAVAPAPVPAPQAAPQAMVAPTQAATVAPIPTPVAPLAPPAPASIPQPHPHPPAMASAPEAAPLLSPHIEPTALRQDRFLAAMDVLGGVAFAVLMGLIMINVMPLIMRGSGWTGAIGWESIWIITALLCAPLMPSGVEHQINLRSTLHGLALDLPELAIAGYTFIYALQVGLHNGWLGPLAFSLSVGVAEEFIFRVLLLGWLITRLDTAPALMVSAAVFGLAHLHELSVLGVMSVIPQFSGGLLLGAIYLRTRNPLGPILAHALWDFPIFLAYGNGSGGGTEAGMPSVVGVLFWLAFGIYGLWLVRHGVPAAGRREPIAHNDEYRVRFG